MVNDVHTATLTAMSSTTPQAGSPTTAITGAYTSSDNETGIVHL